MIGTISELPLSVFRTAAGKRRQMQIGSCASNEMLQVLESARISGWHYCNLLSHNFELLLRGTDRPEWTVISRFKKLCRFLAENNARFPTINFSGQQFLEEADDLPLPETRAEANFARFYEQGYIKLLENLARITG
jgi:hypothetical protein